MIKYCFCVLFVFMFGFFLGAGLVRHKIVPPLPASVLQDNIPWLKNQLNIPIVNEKILINYNNNVN